jgi:hypothetical protein
MDWKVRLEGDDNTLGNLQQYNNPASKIMRDGVDWYLESSEFQMLSDYKEVRQKAAVILGSILGNGAVSGATVGMGPVYRMHYDNSKTVYRDD